MPTPLQPLNIQLDVDTVVRMIAEQDAQPLFELIDQNRAHLRQWLPWLDTTRTVEDELAFIYNMYLQFQERKGFTCAIWYKGRPAGTIGCHSIDWQERKVEIGYLLGAQFQGKGLMTKVCRQMVTHAFEQMQLNRVEIRCAVENTRSRAIPLRLGFTEEGIIRQAEWLYDHYVDLVLYSMLAHQWRQ